MNYNNLKKNVKLTMNGRLGYINHLFVSKELELPKNFNEFVLIVIDNMKPRTTSNGSEYKVYDLEVEQWLLCTTEGMGYLQKRCKFFWDKLNENNS